MSFIKPSNRSKAIKQADLYRNFTFMFFLLVLLSALLLVNNVFAATTFLSNYNYGEKVSYKMSQQKADFAQARQSYDAQEYIYSARLFSILAEQGHNKAQYLLATQYDMGLGVDTDKQAAFLGYQQAAMGGVRIAQHNLAVSYSKGIGTSKNLAKAVHWWKRAANNGSTDAQFNLGIIYASGHGNIEQNLEQALKWWKMAAMSGDAAAQFNIGAMYANGLGVSGHACEATHWWKKSAENGFAQAKMALALLETRKALERCQ